MARKKIIKILFWVAIPVLGFISFQSCGVKTYTPVKDNLGQTEQQDTFRLGSWKGPYDDCCNQYSDDSEECIQGYYYLNTKKIPLHKINQK